MIDKKRFPLVLSADIKNWNIPINHGTDLDDDVRMKNIRKTILERDKHTCQYCGWRSSKHQEIHHLDGNHNNFNENNLATVCPLCHQVHHLSNVGITRGGGIGLLQELTQEEVNIVFIHIFIALHHPNKKYREIAKTIRAAFEDRVTLLRNNQSIGDGASDPDILAEALLRSPKEFYQNREKTLDFLKIIPMEEKFIDRQIKYWVSKTTDQDLEKWNENFTLINEKILKGKK